MPRSAWPRAGAASRRLFDLSPCSVTPTGCSIIARAAPSRSSLRRGSLGRWVPSSFTITVSRSRDLRRRSAAPASRLTTSLESEDEMAETLTLFVCHGDDGGPRIHPCRRVQEALRAAGIGYDKVIAGHGSPIPFLRKGSRDALRDATGATKLPALKLPDGTVITHSRAILSWIAQQK